MTAHSGSHKRDGRCQPFRRAFESGLTRRDFIATTLTAVAAASASVGCKSVNWAGSSEIIDIHQHVGYSGRTNEELIAHQDAMGVSRTILLPAGRPMKTESTHQGISNGLQASALGNEACCKLAKAFPRKFYFTANEVPDAPDAEGEITKYLKLGAIGIAEQKFGVECDSLEMQRLYSLAADFNVPILMHWQHQMYNYGFERFHKMLQKYPKTVFIGHAQTWWANVDLKHTDQTQLYPRGKVQPGGMTDRYLRDYPNMYGDLSAGSGLNSLTRDEEHAKEFLARHQDKLLYGSDCNDRDGTGTKCQGWQTIQTLRRLSPSETITQKILCKNAARVFHL